MSAESAAERIQATAEQYHSDGLAFLRGNSWEDDQAMIAQIIREETRCERLAEALRRLDAAAGSALACSISRQSNAAHGQQLCDLCRDKLTEARAEARALLAEMDAPAREGGPGA